MSIFEPSREICVDKKRIGLEHPVYFIAEIGSNFDNEIDRAKDLIYMAKDAGADAAKFQHYTADSLVNDLGFKEIGNSLSHQASWDKSVYETYKSAQINADWTQLLSETCEEVGLSFFTSPYSIDLVDTVDNYVPAYKVGSGDITWLEIIKHMCSKGKPIILATGASSFDDVCRAVDTILKITPDIILLQCNTNYTASRNNFSHLQLNVLSTFQRKYPGIILGLSDHMPGHVPVLGSVALGARVIEKHFTDSVDRPGPDHSFSMTPKTWREMVDRTRELEMSLGKGLKKIEKNELETVNLQRRSIFTAKKMKKGAKIKKEDLIVLRPFLEGSLHPFEMNSLINKTINRDIDKNESIKWADIDESI